MTAFSEVQQLSEEELLRNEILYNAYSVYGLRSQEETDELLAKLNRISSTPKKIVYSEDRGRGRFPLFIVDASQKID